MVRLVDGASFLQVVNLSDTRSFFSKRKSIYIFRVRVLALHCVSMDPRFACYFTSLLVYPVRQCSLFSPFHGSQSASLDSLHPCSALCFILSHCIKWHSSLSCQVLEWESLSLDIIPHPDMFDDDLVISAATASAREEDGARRLFFGGERIVDNVAGKAFVSG